MKCWFWHFTTLHTAESIKSWSKPQSVKSGEVFIVTLHAYKCLWYNLLSAVCEVWGLFLKIGLCTYRSLLSDWLKPILKPAAGRLSKIISEWYLRTSSHFPFGDYLWASCRIRTNDPEITNHVLWPTELKRRVGKLAISRRYNLLPLLRSSPGGFAGSWPYRTYPFFVLRVQR